MLDMAAVAAVGRCWEPLRNGKNTGTRSRSFSRPALWSALLLTCCFQAVFAASPPSTPPAGFTFTSVDQTPFVAPLFKVADFGHQAQGAVWLEVTFVIHSVTRADVGGRPAQPALNISHVNARPLAWILQCDTAETQRLLALGDGGARYCADGFFNEQSLCESWPVTESQWLPLGPPNASVFNGVESPVGSLVMRANVADRVDTAGFYSYFVAACELLGSDVAELRSETGCKQYAGAGATQSPTDPNVFTCNWPSLWENKMAIRVDFAGSNPAMTSYLSGPQQSNVPIYVVFSLIFASMSAVFWIMLRVHSQKTGDPRPWQWGLFPPFVAKTVALCLCSIYWIARQTGVPATTTDAVIWPLFEIAASIALFWTFWLIYRVISGWGTIVVAPPRNQRKKMLILIASFALSSLLFDYLGISLAPFSSSIPPLSELFTGTRMIIVTGGRTSTTSTATSSSSSPSGGSGGTSGPASSGSSSSSSSSSPYVSSSSYPNGALITQLSTTPDGQYILTSADSDILQGLDLTGKDAAQGIYPNPSAFWDLDGSAGTFPIATASALSIIFTVAICLIYAILIYSLFGIANETISTATTHLETLRVWGYQPTNTSLFVKFQKLRSFRSVLIAYIGLAVICALLTINEQVTARLPWLASVMLQGGEVLLYGFIGLTYRCQKSLTVDPRLVAAAQQLAAQASNGGAQGSVSQAVLLAQPTAANVASPTSASSNSAGPHNAQAVSADGSGLSLRRRHRRAHRNRAATIANGALSLPLPAVREDQEHQHQHQGSNGGSAEGIEMRMRGIAAEAAVVAAAATRIARGSHPLVLLSLNDRPQHSRQQQGSGSASAGFGGSASNSGELATGDDNEDGGSGSFSRSARPSGLSIASLSEYSSYPSSVGSCSTTRTNATAAVTAFFVDPWPYQHPHQERALASMAVGSNLTGAGAAPAANQLKKELIVVLNPDRKAPPFLGQIFAGVATTSALPPRGPTPATVVTSASSEEDTALSAAIAASLASQRSEATAEDLHEETAGTPAPPSSPFPPSVSLTNPLAGDEDGAVAAARGESEAPSDVQSVAIGLVDEASVAGPSAGSDAEQEGGSHRSARSSAISVASVATSLGTPINATRNNSQVQHRVSFSFPLTSAGAGPVPTADEEALPPLAARSSSAGGDDSNTGGASSFVSSASVASRSARGSAASGSFIAAPMLSTTLSSASLGSMGSRSSTRDSVVTAANGSSHNNNDGSSSSSSASSSASSPTTSASGQPQQPRSSSLRNARQSTGAGSNGSRGSGNSGGGGGGFFASLARNANRVFTSGAGGSSFSSSSSQHQQQQADGLSDHPNAVVNEMATTAMMDDGSEAVPMPTILFSGPLHLPATSLPPAPALALPSRLQLPFVPPPPRLPAAVFAAPRSQILPPAPPPWQLRTATATSGNTRPTAFAPAPAPAPPSVPAPAPASVVVGEEIVPATTAWPPGVVLPSAASASSASSLPL